MEGGRGGGGGGGVGGGWVLHVCTMCFGSNIPFLCGPTVNYVHHCFMQVVDGMKFIFATTQSRVYKISVERCSRHRSYKYV